jgi:hypothetical protein
MLALSFVEIDPQQTLAVGVASKTGERHTTLNLLWFDFCGANDLSPLVSFIRNQLGEVCR